MTEAPEPSGPHPGVIAAALGVAVVTLALAAAAQRSYFAAARPSAPAGSAASGAAIPRTVASAAVSDEPPPPSPRAVPVIHRPTLTDVQRGKGLNECATPDPGDGSFQPKHLFPWGVIQIPREGGATEDHGYDVIVHFHGGDGARKAIAPLGTGLTLVGIDRGEGSGSYDGMFPLPVACDALRKAITGQLATLTKQPDAHIRHFALSSWSAGYGATISYLRNCGDADVDAVVLLDSLHASYGPAPSGASPYALLNRTIDDIYPPSLAPALAFAERAKRGERIFFLTHSHIVPRGYPSTTAVAKYLTRALDLPRIAAPPTDDPFGLLTYTDSDTIQVRSFEGNAELAHCTHLAYLADAVLDFLLPSWQTPPPTTPASDEGTAAAAASP